jgi:hypothetical protein
MLNQSLQAEVAFILLAIGAVKALPKVLLGGSIKLAKNASNLSRSLERSCAM